MAVDVATGGSFLAPDLRRSGTGVRVGVNRARASQGGSSRAEFSQQFDPITGRQLGRLIIPGTATAQTRRKNQQDDLFAEILGAGFGTGSKGRDFFPLIDPTTGENLSRDFRGLRPDQILTLAGRGGGPDLSSIGGRDPLVAEAPVPGFLGGGLGSTGGTARPPENGAGGPGLLPLIGIAAGGVLLLLLMSRGRK